MAMEMEDDFPSGSELSSDEEVHKNNMPGSYQQLFHFKLISACSYQYHYFECMCLRAASGGVFEGQSEARVDSETRAIECLHQQCDKFLKYGARVCIILQSEAEWLFRIEPAGSQRGGGGGGGGGAWYITRGFAGMPQEF